MLTLDLADLLEIGRNPWYSFHVARHRDAREDRWIGFAVGHDAKAADLDGATVNYAGMVQGDKVPMLFVFPEVGSDGRLGLLDRDEAIRLTGAIAQDPEHGYGGVERWRIPEDLRATPDEFRCEHCNAVGCDGLLCVEDEEEQDGWYGEAE
jgi:hypothetical protein